MNSKKQDNEQKKTWYMRKENWWIIAGFIIAIFAVGAPFLIMFLTNQGFKLDNFNNLGVVGDFFGGTTVGLLSLASIVFVTAAIIMQKEELALQREEVEKTREEYHLTNMTMKKQQFDNTFFNMIQLQNEILNTIEITKSTGQYIPSEGYKENKIIYKSRGAIEVLYKDLTNKFNKSTKQYDELLEIYEHFYFENQNIIGHYYRNLYRIVKFVYSQNINLEDQKFYIGLIRAQLSSYELIMLFYNVGYSKAGEKFKNILKGKNFFQDHIPNQLFVNDLDIAIIKQIED